MLKIKHIRIGIIRIHMSNNIENKRDKLFLYGKYILPNYCRVVCNFNMFNEMIFVLMAFKNIDKLVK